MRRWGGGGLNEERNFRHTACNHFDFYLYQISVMPLINSLAKAVKHISKSQVLIIRKSNVDTKFYFSFFKDRKLQAT